MNTDLTFITNEEGNRLKERLEVLFMASRFFDCLVGYFYASGFHALSPALERIEKIRILAGINIDKNAYELITSAGQNTDQTLYYSTAEVKHSVGDNAEKEFEESQDNSVIENGVIRFIEWIKNKKLEIRAYPSQNIHAKLYILTFKEGTMDVGRVITGSSNLTMAGLSENLEFNVELKNSVDYKFSLSKFNELWENAVDVGEKYVQTIETRTWLNQNITPYHLYLKQLYEYFKDELGRTDEVFVNYLPEGFMKLEYQEQAVLNARKILEEYGGVFISDVVGLGKTYIATLLAGQLDGRTLVIAPPVLLDKDNPGSWPNAISDFRVAADTESIGKLDDIIERGTDKYTNIIIDEAHRFRTETTISYEKLAEICRGKRVILVTATPYNNSPRDILSQIKLFQSARKSTIPNVPDIESFLNGLYNRLKGLDRQSDYTEYMSTVKKNSREIREKVLKYLMVRRTRTEVIKYFSKDLKEQKLKFPEVEAPQALYYKLNDDEDAVFSETIELISRQFTYARYTPLLYYTGREVDQLEVQSQRNMGKFMKILLVKRLESSFFAFRNSIDRFIHSYEMYLKEFNKGNVYISKKYISKIFDLLEDDDDQAIQKFIDEGKAECYESAKFTPEFKADLENDLETLNKVKSLWHTVKRDPKLNTLLKQISSNPYLSGNKVVLFTESGETAEYITKHINEKHPMTALCFSGNSDEFLRDKVIANFDAKARHPKNDYRILVSTEVLSEGVNLHRSNVVVNYDIPWNPTRMMQRVGRINRVDTSFSTIHTFNFFPTVQSNNQIKLKEAAEAKINAFLSLLGGDAALLTEGEPVGSHELFDRLFSKKTVTGEDESETSELKYLRVIKELRDNDPELFDKIKRLPKKARSAKKGDKISGKLVTFFHRGKLQKFFITGGHDAVLELDFLSAAELLESSGRHQKQPLPADFFELLDRNKEAFLNATSGEETEFQAKRGRDSAWQIQKILKAILTDTKKLTEDQEAYLREVHDRLSEGALPKQTAKDALRALEKLGTENQNPLKAAAVLQSVVPQKLLERHYAEQIQHGAGKREVILSMYLTGE